MKVLLLIGDHLRHFHLAKKLENEDMLAGLVIEERNTMIPEPPKEIDLELRELFVKHFQGRLDAEERFFGQGGAMELNTPKITITRQELNGIKVLEFIKNTPHDVAISYGVHFLKSDILNELSDIKWNIHGGLSPWYRGCITLFWPSYMLEPQMTGMTIHELTNALDGGPIVHHSVPVLKRGDGIHDLACRAVCTVACDLVQILRLYEQGKLEPSRKQKSSGKLWIEQDWRPDHLLLIYKYFNNRIVDAYLDGKIKGRIPRLVKQPI